MILRSKLNVRDAMRLSANPASDRAVMVAHCIRNAMERQCGKGNLPAALVRRNEELKFD